MGEYRLASAGPVGEEDVDALKHTSSRLQVGTILSRDDMLHLALMSSENRAAHALGRHFPSGLNAFVTAMNQIFAFFNNLING